MLTPQEVSARSFTKMVMGGYNMTMVDEFLDELTDDYTTLYKENAALKAKLKVLVEKVEEYRATEDSMRAALLTAQRMADTIVKEAEGKRDEILSQAETAARSRLEDYRRQAEESDQRLRRGKEELQHFVDQAKALCSKQIQLLEALPSLDLGKAAEEAKIEETVLAVETAAEVVPAAAVAPESAIPVSVPSPAKPAEPVAVSMGTQTVMPSAEQLLNTLAAAEEAAPVEDLSATRRVNINDLKFGPNYRSEAK